MAGILTVIGAVALRHVTQGRGRRLLPCLSAIFGASYVIAGLFPPDPMFAFPVGTPDGPPVAVSWHAAIHVFAASLGFLALLASIFVGARRYARAGNTRLARNARVAGSVAIIAIAPSIVGSRAAGVPLLLFGGVAVGWGWLAVSARSSALADAGPTGSLGPVK